MRTVLMNNTERTIKASPPDFANPLFIFRMFPPAMIGVSLAYVFAFFKLNGEKKKRKRTRE
jgi:hypothetical protein